jgi:hypothetical protein
MSKAEWRKILDLKMHPWVREYDSSNKHDTHRRAGSVLYEKSVMRIEEVTETPAFYYFTGIVTVYDMEGVKVRESFEITKKRKPFLLPASVQEQLERLECMKY